MQPRSATQKRPIHVLVIDDSAVVRTAMSAIFAKEPGISVAVASDPIIGMNKMQSARPDVIVLDLELPRMDGLTFLQRLMAEDPLPVVVCSSLAGPTTEAALRSVELGAVDVVQKPRLGVRGFIEDSAVMLVDAIRAAACARVRARVTPTAAPPLAASPDFLADAPLLTRTTDKVVAIGASTGGTEALRYILEAMPPDGPAIVIVQHMPEVFTKAFADRLNESCRVEVKEAEDGDRVIEGRALIAPGNRHMRVIRSGAHYIAQVSDGGLVSRHRPSVDVMFHSVAKAAGPNALGVIMTGMGDDGARGLLAMKYAGATTLAQDEASCVVFGMPKEAIGRGAVSRVVTLGDLPRAILQRFKK